VQACCSGISAQQRCLFVLRHFCLRPGNPGYGWSKYVHLIGLTCSPGLREFLLTTISFLTILLSLSHGPLTLRARSYQTNHFATYHKQPTGQVVLGLSGHSS
jgi:hypothetical protein